MYKALKAREVYKTFLNNGWEHTRTSGSHRIMRHESGQTFSFSFADKETIGPKMVSRIVAKTGLPVLTI